MQKRNGEKPTSKLRQWTGGRAWSHLKRGEKTFSDFHPKTKVRLRRG